MKHSWVRRTLVAGGAVVLLTVAGATRAADLPVDAVEVPPSTSSTDQQAAALARSGGGEALRLLAQRWVRSLPRSANAWFYHGLVAEMSGSKSWAVDDYRHALELAPGLGAASYALGRTLASMDKYNAAVEPLRLASAAYPQNSRIWADYGAALGELGRYQDAANALQRSVRLDPGNGNHAGELADLYAALKDYAHAVPLYRQASRKTPADAANFAWLGNLGQVYELMGDYRSSVATLQQALRYAPNDSSLWSCLWVDYVKLGNAAEAAHAKATLARLDAPRKDGMSRAAADVLATAKQQHEAYLRTRGELSAREHLP